MTSRDATLQWECVWVFTLKRLQTETLQKHNSFCFILLRIVNIHFEMIKTNKDLQTQFEDFLTQALCLITVTDKCSNENMALNIFRLKIIYFVEIVWDNSSVVTCRQHMFFFSVLLFKFPCFISKTTLLLSLQPHSLESVCLCVHVQWESTNKIFFVIYVYIYFFVCVDKTCVALYFR